MIILICIGGFLGFPSYAAPGEAPTIPEDHFPRTANYFLRWDLSATQAYELARYDLLILDMEVQVNTPRQLELIRSLNPDIIILAYVTSQEILNRAQMLPESSLRRRLYEQIAPEWFLTDRDGKRVSYWPSTSLLNVTDFAPKGDGRRWNTVLPKFMHDEVMSTGYWDGIFFDNAWDDVSFVNSGDLDLNHDGVAEDAVALDQAWTDGMKKMLNHSRRLEGGEAILMGNGGNGFDEQLNGRMFESFPTKEEGGWSGSMSSYQLRMQQAQEPGTTIINVNTDNSGIMEDFERFRFGLASTLMMDGFYSFDDGDQGHAVNWFFDEYKVELGKPKGKAKNIFQPKQNIWQEGIWRRDFQQGIVMLNATDRIVDVPLGGYFETIKGEQDSTVNTGEVVDRVVLQPRDGRVLLRPFSFLDDVALKNDAETKVFSMQGQELRKPFVAHEARFAVREQVIRTNLDFSEGRETIATRGNTVRIFDSHGKILSRFTPYGPNFNGRVMVATGQIKGDARPEIVTSTDVDGGPHIRMFDARGQMIDAGFFAFNSRQRGGASLAVADVTGDGRGELIVGAGKGSAPIVRIFSGDGELIHSGFSVFESGFRGGVAVGAGPLRKGKRSEIVVAPLTGGEPLIKMFKADGHLLKAGFFAFEPTVGTGLRLGVADINFDEQLEIIVQKNT